MSLLLPTNNITNGSSLEIFAVLTVVCACPSPSAQELSLKVEEIEKLLIDLILDQRLHGKIDQIEGFLLLEASKETISSRKHDAMERWSNALRSLNSHLVERVEH